MKKVKNTHGFTLVELLIVIVVIAILAAITIVAYSGVQNRAYDVTVQSDLHNSYQSLLQYAAVNGAIPSDQGTLKPLLVATKSAYYTDNNAYLYCFSNDAIALVGRSKSGATFYDGTKGAGQLASWTDASASLCPSVGVPTTNSGYISRWLYANGIWQGWYAS